MKTLETRFIMTSQICWHNDIIENTSEVSLKEWESFFQSSWGMNRSAAQTNLPRTASRFTRQIVWIIVRFLEDLFVWRSNSNPMNPETKSPKGTDRSTEYNEHFCYKLDSRVKKLTTEWNQKQQHFITHASRSLLWIRSVAVAFRSEED